MMVVSRQLAMVYRIAVAQTQHRADAEDIAQEVFLEYAKRRPTFENAEHEKAWFIRVTLHRARNLHQSTWRKQRQEMPETLSTPDGNGDVHAALLSLPDDARTIIYLYYYESMDIAGIAHALKLSQSAVKKRLQRARDTLRHLLGDENNEG